MIMSCGEALIDMLPRKTENGEDSFLPVAGGAVFNTAITLGRLGENASFLTGISTDLFGEQLLSVLKDSNVDTSLCPRVPNNTTLAFVKLTNDNAEYSFFDDNSATRCLQEDMLPALPTELQALHFGAISLIPEPSGSAYEALMNREAPSKVISLDPNIRTSFISDAPSHRKRIERMIAKSDIVKVSDEDLEWIAPDTSSEDSIQGFLNSGVSVVLLTKGADGVDAFTSRGKIEVASQKVEVADTIGAGDSFNGGFLSGLRQSGNLTKDALKTISESDLTKAIELANAVAAITVSRAGANPPWKEELKHLF
ncbi:MAG: carbohydrate kinase [Nitratireductor sp.]